MIACHNDDIRIQLRHAWNRGIEFFRPLDLQCEIAIFARRIGVLPVDEEEIIIVPGGFEPIHLVFECMSGIENVHTDQTSQAAIHRIDRDGSCSHAIHFLERRNVRHLVDSAKRQEVCRGVIFQHFLRLSQKCFRDFRRLGATR